jgi:hypothetical protein
VIEISVGSFPSARHLSANFSGYIPLWQRMSIGAHTRKRVCLVSQVAALRYEGEFNSTDEVGPTTVFRLCAINVSLRIDTYKSQSRHFRSIE